MLYVIRVSLPDVPGSLGSVATSLSSLGADIVELRVVDRDGNHAVDEICFSCEGVVIDEIRSTVESIPGVVVETVRRVAHVPDPLSAIMLADSLARHIGDPVTTLTEGLPEAMPCTWALALEAVGNELEVLAATPDAPPPGVMVAPWLPLIGARRIGITDRMPPRWRMHRFELAAAPLDDPTRFVMVGRPTGMRFHLNELRLLELLCDIALAKHNASAGAMTAST